MNLMPVNREAMIETIHELQVDCQMLADGLARDSAPVLSEMTVYRLATMHDDMKYYTPSLLRH
jgi:hypothetical protein